MEKKTTKQKFHALVKTMDPLVKTKDGKVKGGVLVIDTTRPQAPDAPGNNCALVCNQCVTLRQP